MFETIIKFFKRIGKSETKETNSKDKAKERLHLVLMQDRANVSADFLEMMKQEIIEVIKKYIEVEEDSIDVRLTNEVREDGTTGAPSLYANIPILNIRNEMKKESVVQEKKDEGNNEEKKTEEVKQEKSEEKKTEEVEYENGKEEKFEEVKEIKEDENSENVEENMKEKILQKEEVQQPEEKKDA